MDILYYIFLVLAYIAAIGFFVFGLDDVFFDLQFLRYLRKKRKRPSVTLEQLKNEPEQLIAIFVPAWNEGGIINRMADYASRILLYDRYDIFIGVYPNDAETGRCVDLLVASNPRIHKAVTKSNGPTSKADCLNAIFEAMKAHEVAGRREYRIIALHDAEDIIHPLTLKVYNYHVPRTFDMGQIPVFPLELDPWKYWVGNTYMDEFSEWHMKDMYSREVMGGVVPSAGVGTAISRKALDFLDEKHGGGPFQVGNLAEDYMMGLELCRSGFRAGFVDFYVEREVKTRDPKGNVTGTRMVSEPVAVRENFPTTFRHAVKQKARWIVGTAFQGWERGGWWGSAAVKYTLVRDRRAPLVHCINAAGYIVILYVLAEFILLHLEWRNSIFLRPLFTPEGLLWRIVLVDTALLVYRVAQKVAFVSEIYGLRLALFAILRYPVVNVVNMSATLRAGWLYAGHRFFNRPLAWTKTTHAFPDEATLAEFTRSVEDLIVEEGLIERPALEKIMSEHAGFSAPEALLRMNLIDEEQFTGIWSRFSGLPPQLVIPGDVPVERLDVWTEEYAVHYHAMPCGNKESEAVGFLFEEPPSREDVDRVSAVVGNPIRVFLGRPTNLLCLRQNLYPRRSLKKTGYDCFESVLRTLRPEDQRAVLEFQFTRRRSLADALISLNIISEQEASHLFAKHLGVSPADLSARAIDTEQASRWGCLFCEVHLLVPLIGGLVAVGESVHPDVLQRIEISHKVSLCAGSPPVFRRLWRKFMELRLAENALLGWLRNERMLSEEGMERVKAMQKLIAGPIDHLLIQLNVLTREQIWDGLLATSGLTACRRNATPHPLLKTAGVLAPGFPERSGIFLSEVDGSCPVFGLRQLPTADDLTEVYERCDGAGAKFQLQPRP